jgi:histone H3/H4
MAKKAKQREVVVVASKVKDAVKESGCQSSGDLIEAISDKVHDMLEAAVERAKNNGRATVRPYDL